MKLFKPSIRTFRRRLASIDSAPQFAILGIASGFLTGLVIIAFRLAIEWPLDRLLEEGPESFETLDISATFMKELSNGTLKLRVYGTDVLEDGNRVGRRYDAGSFAWAELVPRRQMGVTVGYEF